MVALTVNPPRTRRPSARNDGNFGLGKRSHLLDAGGYVTLIFAVLVMSVPLIWMVFASFKQPNELYSMPLQWLPESFDGANYAHVAQTLPIGRLFLNSVMLTVVGAGLKVILGLTCAYALVFIEFPYKKIMFTIVLFTLLVPQQITIIPNYTLVSQLGWLNTYQGILVPGLASAFGTFLFRQHFLSLPGSVLEAASLDGAGHWRRLWAFVVPMSYPTISAVLLVSLVAEWNDYLWPFLVIDNAEMMTLPLGLTLLQNVDGMNNWGVLMAATVLVTLPMLVVFLVLQRRLVAGLTAGAVTG
ncbi:carbohydrate ABC transporter permease [Timonella senegalensis]|uniref:carbohydrate ABC transporter permease n=1 Tax=Timonella senegalensis TaxID=1465825 RepID=UPI0002EBFB5A|nr:carbohydrate ABC transporter permease [Timonella senegalensis]